MSTPQPPVAPQSPANDSSQQGSLGLGVAIAWGVLIGGYAVAITLVAGVVGMGSAAAALGPLVALLPWLLMLGLILWFATHNKPRTALGIAIGIASIIGVGLLLVAACFGLLAISR